MKWTGESKRLPRTLTCWGGQNRICNSALTDVEESGKGKGLPGGVTVQRFFAGEGGVSTKLIAGRKEKYDR